MQGQVHENSSQKGQLQKRAHDAKQNMRRLLVFLNRVVWPVDSLIVVQESMAV